MKLKNLWKKTQSSDDVIIKTKDAIEIKDLTFKYPGTKKDTWHLDKISLKIQKGNWTTVLDPNGSGKSTLAKAIVRINKAKKGKIMINGQNIHDYSGKAFARNVAYITQILDIPYGTSVYDFVSFGRNPYLGVTGTLTKKDKKIIQDAMEETRTWEWKNKMMDELSGGQRQKVLIAMVITQNADIIILDEPTTYLDIRNQYELLEMMHYEHIKGRTIVTILHDINQAAQYSDLVYVLDNGKINTFGTPAQLINKNMLKEVYGVEAELYENNNKKYFTDVKLHDFNYGKDTYNHKHKVKYPVEVITNKKK